MAIPGTCAEVVESQVLCVAFRLIQWYLALVFQIALVAHHDDGELLAQLVSQLLYPPFHFLITVSVRDVIHD